MIVLKGRVLDGNGGPPIEQGAVVLEGNRIRLVCRQSELPELEGAQVCLEEAVADGPFVTGRGLGTAVPFGLALVEALEGRPAACRLAGQIVWMHGEQA